MSNRVVDELQLVDVETVSSVFLCPECWDEVREQDVVQEIGPSRFFPSPHHDEFIVTE